MSTYLLNCDKLNFFQTFQTMDEVLTFLNKENKENFDGDSFSIFGRGQREEIVNDEPLWTDSSYYSDSVVLCPKDNPNTYFKFIIRRIDLDGNIIELD